MTFPEKEWSDIARRLKDKGQCSTIRCCNEFGKYEVGQIYSTPWGDVVEIIRVDKYSKAEDIPTWPLMDKAMKISVRKGEKFGDSKWDYVVFSKVKASTHPVQSFENNHHIMKPDLKLSVNVESDIDNAKWFVKNGEFVDWFLPLNLQFVMSDNFSSKERNKIISEYTKHIYQLDKKKILSGVNDTKKRWTAIERDFYSLVNELFKGHPWPKGKYVGHASIFLMFPRNINERSFYFPYSNDNWDPIGTIAHEMLHFIFFDYIKKRYGINENDEFEGKDQRYVWRVSETFNTVIENWQPYKKAIESNEITNPYPECKTMFKKMSQQWARCPDIEKLLDSWMANLR